jgi:hypothetical protein
MASDKDICDAARSRWFRDCGRNQWLRDQPADFKYNAKDQTVTVSDLRGALQLYRVRQTPRGLRLDAAQASVG